MGIQVEKIKVILKLNQPLDKNGFSRIFQFVDASQNGARLKARFKRIDDRTFESNGSEYGTAVLQEIIGADERSGLDTVRLLNRGGTSDIDIAHIDFSADINSDKTGRRTVSVLQGDVNKVLKAERHTIALDKCNPGLRAKLALKEANLDGIILPYTVDVNELTSWFNTMKREHPPTLYNGIKNAKRVGWAIISRKGAVDDIHGRRYEKYSKEAEFHVPTPICNGYMKQILEDLQPQLGTIYRARLIGIKGFRAIAPHHDGHDGTLFYRYHIPIIPNKHCIFNSAGKDFVMDEPGRLYRFPAWETHSVVNYDGDRVHLLFSASGKALAA